MSEKVAFVDVDNTLWDFEGEMRRRMIEILGADKVPKEFGYWNEPEDLLGSAKAAHDIFNEMHATQHHYEPFPGAINVLRSLKRMRYKILIATNRIPETRESLVCWLDDFEMPYDEIFCDLGKERLFNERNDIELVIDDAPYIIEDADKRGIEVLALRYPYNKNILGVKKFKHCQEMHEYLTRAMLF